MGFKTFAAIYLAIVVIVSAFVIAVTPRLGTRNDSASSNHFSVRWLGFIPDYYGPYKDDYPDYYICINDLKDSVLTMHIAMKIENFENSSYWFLIESYTTPPDGWTLTPYQIGYINIDETKTFTYSNINRIKPSSIPERRLTESIQLVIKAYRDSSYTDLYSQDNFPVTFHFIDRTSSTWTILSYENGEDAPFQNWETFGGSGWYQVSYEKYRSWPNSLKHSGGLMGKWFDTTGSFSEAYLICPVYLDVINYFIPRIQLNYTDYFVVDTALNKAAWFLLTIPLPLDSVTHFRINGDEV